MRSLLASATLLLTACHVNQSTVRSVELLEYGTFRKTQSSGYASAPNAIAGKMNVVADAILIEPLTQIPASRGTSFGVRVKLVGDPDGLVVRCRAKCLHPKYTDPATGRSSESEEWPNDLAIGRAAYVGYTFDNDWEIVPGRWTIQIFVGSRLEAEQSFTVVELASNQALERTATRRAFTFQMIRAFSVEPALALGGGRSAYSR